MGKESGSDSVAKNGCAQNKHTGAFRFAQFCVLAASMVAASVSPATSAAVNEVVFSEVSKKASQSLLLDVTRTAESPRIVSVGDRGHILFSDDDGLTWQQAKVPTIQMLTAVYFSSPEIGYAVGHDSLVLKTVDGGENWRKVYEDKAFEAPLLDVWFENDDRGIALGAYGSILETRNGGKSWSDISHKMDNQEEFHYNAIAGDELGNVYIAGEAGIVLHSSNYGQTWSRLKNPYKGSFFGVTASKGQVLVHGLRGNVFQSSDMGQEWKSMSTGSGETLFGSVSLKGGKSILVGNSGSFVSVNKGQWQSTNRTDRVSLSALTVSSDGNIVAVGQGGVHRMSSVGKSLAN